jgi:hypothetical protein
MKDTARAVDAQNPYRGMELPVVTTPSTSEGRKMYRGMEPAVKSMKVLRRPMESDTAAQPKRPPRLPAESIKRNLAANADVTTAGRAEENT